MCFTKDKGRCCCAAARILEESSYMTRSTSKTTSQPKFINSRRRGFLQSAAVVSAGAGVGVGTASADELPGIEVEEPDKAHKGYEETDHVRDYYRKARL